MTDINQRIDSFLQERLDDYIAETSRLCAQPSVSATGEGVAECADLLADILAQRGYQVQKLITAGNPIVVAHAAGAGDRTLLFYNHYDVQPPEPLELWTSPPFEPAVRDGALYARGAVDDKGEIAARLAAIDAVRAAHDGILPCNVTFVVEGEEEIASPHIAQFVQDHVDLLQCQGAIWEQGYIDPSGRPLNAVGVRGILAVEITIETMSTDAHSGGAHALPNAAWRLVRLLSSLKDADERVLIPGFYDDARSPSAVDLQFLDEMPNHEEIMRAQYGVREFVRGASGKQLRQAVFEPTCNIQGITTGYQGQGTKTVIPARASVKIDFRLVPDQNPDDLYAKLRTHLDAQGFADAQLSRLGAMWPAKTDPDHPLVQLAGRAGEEVYGMPSLIDPLVGGSTPIYAFAKPLGDIPVIRAGVGHTGCNTHAPDEHVLIKNFHLAARHIARILDGFAQLA